jgi:hypothetical protein
MEANDLASGRLGQRGEIAHRELSKVLNIAPPAPPIQGGNKASQRPIHPAWNNILDPVD